LFDEEGFLFLVGLFKEVLEVTVPDFSDFGVEGLTNRWQAHVHKDLAHQKVVQCDVWAFRAVFCAFEVRL
jgi:hypothetical protein